jgi:hypothetical protein
VEDSSVCDIPVYFEGDFTKAFLGLVLDTFLDSKTGMEYR